MRPAVLGLAGMLIPIPVTAQCLSARDIDASIAPPATTAYHPALAVQQIAPFTHTLFANEQGPVVTRERIPGIDRAVRAKLYALTTAREDQIVYLVDGIPVGTYTLSDACKRVYGWDRMTLEERMTRREGIAEVVERRIDARVPGVVAKDISSLFGYADVVYAGLERLAPYMPYLRAQAIAHGIDEDVPAAIMLQETFGRLTHDVKGVQIPIVSRSGAEGPAQILRENSRLFGLAVPPGRVISRYARDNALWVNEAVHPLLAVEAQLHLLRGNAMGMGSLAGGIAAYHAGPGNVAEALRVAILYPQVPQAQRPDVAQRITEHLFDTPLPIDPRRIIQLADDTAPTLRWLADVLTTAWASRKNAGKFKRESSRYLPSVIAYKSLLAHARATGFFSSMEIVQQGWRAVPRDPGACGPRGPYSEGDGMSPQPCVALFPNMVERERFTHDIMDADQITIAYVPGARALVGEDLLPHFTSSAELRTYNPHVPFDPRRPVRARLLDGVRIYLPRDAATRFFAAHPALRRTPVVAYARGAIGPGPIQVPDDAIDREYARLAADRHRGMPIDIELLERLAEEFAQRCLQAPSHPHAMQCDAIAQDVAMHDGKLFRRFLRVIPEVAP